MRFEHRDGTRIHLAYCTNVHPAEDLDDLIAQIRTFGGGIRARLGVDRLGLGLWLPAPVVARLSDHPELDRLRTTVDDHGIEVVALNAFPYQGFHAPRVKKAVYAPDWVETGRLNYTLDCAKVLAGLLPDDVANGSISTVPLGWRTPWSDDRQSRARGMLDRLAEGLAKLEAETGRVVRVGLEPEPGCVIQTVADAVERLDGVDTDRIGLCLDSCHLAVGFEDPARAVEQLALAGIPVVKTQASAAVHAEKPTDPATRDALARYAEDRFLHQVREWGPAGIAERDDLPDAMDASRALPGDGPWRVHFHIPVHRRPEPPLESTTGVLRDTFAALFGGPSAVTDHVELETYTWSVLPEGSRPGNDDDLVSGLADELGWVVDRLREAGLERA